MSTAAPPATEEPLAAELHEIEVELNQLGLERLVFFSDAVYAIAITLLVVDWAKYFWAVLIPISIFVR